jgi:hypothetical protein
MALLTPIAVTRAGVDITTLNAASAGGDTYNNATSPDLEVLNGSGAPITVYAAVYVDGQTIAQGRAWAIPAGKRYRIQAMPGNYTNPADGLVYLTYSAVTSLSVGVFQ